jgi:hypothetical protein
MVASIEAAMATGRTDFDFAQHGCVEALLCMMEAEGGRQRTLDGGQGDEEWSFGFNDTRTKIGNLSPDAKDNMKARWAEIMTIKAPKPKKKRKQAWE